MFQTGLSGPACKAVDSLMYMDLFQRGLVSGEYNYPDALDEGGSIRVCALTTVLHMTISVTYTCKALCLPKSTACLQSYFNVNVTNFILIFNN